ncbi:fumarylacetoacetate hydrolase family protein [Lichenibacterium dinghuense]|uniref:fumarylacetoacetate hydrolase family protein n=1 Tax=Lichenibacterium dinghuense TaxID=2895977 RepID=UPI001F323F7D|nr:fumarylacetoacetate hydrolase family protein [Lichenibacterium sp. 6Y81]
MKLLRVRGEHGPIPCLLDPEGRARSVAAHVADFTPETLPGTRPALAGLDLAALPAVEAPDADLLPPMSCPRNIWCIGLNYSDHAAEAGMPVPSEPILFNKSSATYCGPFAPILHAPTMTKLDWEVELGIVIGRRTLGIGEGEAMDHVFGFTLVNDVSERAWQIERGGQWVKGKSYPNFCPTGPWLVTPDEVADVQDLGLWLDVNGQRMQTGTTAKMVFGVRQIVAYMSQFCQLEPGDLICTGTPPGVGMGLKPPRYLAPGDVVTLGIDGLGAQRQTVTPVGEQAR